MQRFTVALPDDTARWLRDRAALSGVGASAWLARLVERTRRRAAEGGEAVPLPVEEPCGADRPECAAIGEALDRYIDAGPALRRRMAEREDAGNDGPLSLTLQDGLYDERGLPD